MQQLILVVTPPRPTCPPSSTATATADSTASTSTSSHPGTILIAVWSLEQDPALVGVGSARRKGGAKKGAIPIDNGVPVDGAGEAEAEAEAEEGEEGEEEGDQVQDVFVPWALQPAPAKKVRTPKPVPLSKDQKVPYTGPRNTEGKKKRKQLAKEAEARLLAGALEEGQSAEVDVAGLSLESASPPPPPVVTEPAPAPTPTPASAPAAPPQPTFHRYYHLFRHGELSGLAVRAARELGAVMVDRSEDKTAQLGAETDSANQAAGSGWVREVELRCEVWERENWAAQIGVKWVWRD